MKRAEDVPRTDSTGKRWFRAVLLLVLAGLIAIAYGQFRNTLTLDHLAGQEAELRELQDRHPLLIYGVAFLFYVLVTGLSLPGAAGLTLVYGWYFGMLRGVVLVSFASTTGATVAFLMSRFLFRDAIQRRFGDRLQTFNRALESEGPFFLFALRLIPAIPFFVINAVMGLTPIRTRTFWWVSQVGMLAGTGVYVYAGSRIPDLQTLADRGIKAIFTAGQLTQIVLAFVLLGLFPWAVRWIVKLAFPGKSVDLVESATDDANAGSRSDAAHGETP